MSGTLRYRNPELCDQLASRYVTGRMAPAARRRLENLLRDEPVLQEAVARWADQMAGLQTALPGREPPADLWSNIQNAVQIKEAGQAKPHAQARAGGFWHSLLVWRLAAFGGVAAALMLVLALISARGDPEGAVTASYLAPLSRNGEVALVVSGYKEEAPGQSRLFVQWSRSHVAPDRRSLSLWAEDRDNHALVYLGGFSANDDSQWRLNKIQWRALSHSVRLLVSTARAKPDPAQSDYSGPCLQLNQWREQG